MDGANCARRALGLPKDRPSIRHVGYMCLESSSLYYWLFFDISSAAIWGATCNHFEESCHVLLESLVLVQAALLGTYRGAKRK